MQALMLGTLQALSPIHSRGGVPLKRRPCFPSTSTGSPLGMLRQATEETHRRGGAAYAFAVCASPSRELKTNGISGSNDVHI